MARSLGAVAGGGRSVERGIVGTRREGHEGVGVHEDIGSAPLLTCLSGAAFGSGDDQLAPRKELVDGLKQLVKQIAKTPSVLRVNYVLNGDGEKLAKRRLKAVEKLVRKLWKDVGRYELSIETTLQREAGNE